MYLLERFLDSNFSTLIDVIKFDKEYLYKKIQDCPGLFAGFFLKSPDQLE